MHPAPYMDRMLAFLEREYTIRVLYNTLADKYKSWDNYTGTEGMLFRDISLGSLIRLVMESDFVVVGGWASWDCIKLILLSRFFLKKVAVFSDCPMNVDTHSAKYWFKRLFLFNLINYIFCATTSTRTVYSEQYKVDKSRLFFFPYAVDFPGKSRMDPINLKRKEALRETGSLPRILVSNSFYGRKGYEVLLAAFRELEAERLLDNFEITLAGAGEEFDHYRNLFNDLSPRIAFPGWLEYDRYIREMENTDIYIHPSLFEPFGIPPIEAMARGKLCIVSDGVQSTSMLMVNGKNGYVYPASDAGQLAGIIKNLIIEDIYEIGKNASEKVTELYSYNNYSSVLHDCLS